MDNYLNEEQSQYQRVNLENRLIDFALSVNGLLTYLPNDVFIQNLKNQMARSSTSPAFNYGEAQSAESRKDFIHKLMICLKELRETLVGLKFIERGSFAKEDLLLEELKTENNELIAIFMKSIKTSRKNLSQINKK